MFHFKCQKLRSCQRLDQAFKSTPAPRRQAARLMKLSEFSADDRLQKSGTCVRSLGVCFHRTSNFLAWFSPIFFRPVNLLVQDPGQRGVFRRRKFRPEDLECQTSTFDFGTDKPLLLRSKGSSVKIRLCRNCKAKCTREPLYR
jgi:hypothetical protein